MLAFLTWIHQRVIYRQLVAECDEATAQNRAFDETDAMAAFGLDPTAGTRAKLLELRKQAHGDVVKPREPYVIVIFLFAIPQIVGVTERCDDQTQTAFGQGFYGAGDAPLPCELIVQLAMAFRAPALAAVYLLPDPKV